MSTSLQRNIKVGVSHAKSQTVTFSPPSISYVSFAPIFNFSNSLISMTRNSRLAHSTTLSTNPGKYPPPTMTPSLQLRARKSSSSASRTHTPAFAGTMYFASTSAVSSETYGTSLLLSCFVASGAPGVFHPYPPAFFFFPTSFCRSDVCIIPTLTGGSGRKYRAYALARKLVIVRRVGRKVDVRVRRGRWKRAGAKGREERSRV